MSRGPYKVYDLLWAHGMYERVKLTEAPTLPEARAAVRAGYESTGTIPDVIDGAGMSIQVFTNEEVGNWGTK